jgi:hypothetical protein
MHEKHGIADAREITMITSDIQHVTVTDGEGEVLLSIGSSSCPAGLTLEQARFIAKQLTDSATRIEERV